MTERTGEAGMSSDGHRPDRLPRGPHQLTPEDVTANQRRRLVDAVVELVGAQGYTATSVADVLAHSRVSRRSFYELFSNRDELLELAFATTATSTFEEARALCERDECDAASLEAFVRSLCQRASDQPGAVSLCSVEIAATPDGHELRAALMERYAELIQSCLSANDGQPVPQPLASTLAGALHRAINASAHDPRPDALRLLPPLLAHWTRSYHPVPAYLLAEPLKPWPWIEPDGLAGGRAPGTLTLSPDGRPAPIDTAPRGLRAHAYRERILDAVAQLNAERGHSELTRRAIAERAEVTQHIFRREFKNCEEAFSAALEIGHLKGQAIVARTRAGAPTWRDGVRDAIHAYLEFLASEPYFARLAFIDAPLCSTRDARRSNEHVSCYAKLMFEGAPKANRPAAIAPEAIVHGLFELAYRHAARDRIAELLSAAAEATYLALAPYIGVSEAADAASRWSAGERQRGLSG